jgi:molybdopterin-binding protein
MMISARNNLKGKIKKLLAGTVNTEVIVELAGGAEIVSIITKESAERLKLSARKEVFAVIKASDVMIAAD